MDPTKKCIVREYTEVNHKGRARIVFELIPYTIHYAECAENQNQHQIYLSAYESDPRNVGFEGAWSTTFFTILQGDESFFKGFETGVMYAGDSTVNDDFITCFTMKSNYTPPEFEPLRQKKYIDEVEGFKRIYNLSGPLDYKTMLSHFIHNSKY